MNGEKLRKYIGEKIKELRIKKNLTQKELGEKIGVAYNTISAYERGKIAPDGDRLFMMADVLDCKMDDFFPPMSDGGEYLNMIKGHVKENLTLNDMQFFRELIEKALSLNDEEREKFMESIRFTVKYFEEIENKK